MEQHSIAVEKIRDRILGYLSDRMMFEVETDRAMEAATDEAAEARAMDEAKRRFSDLQLAHRSPGAIARVQAVMSWSNPAGVNPAGVAFVSVQVEGDNAVALTLEDRTDETSQALLGPEHYEYHLERLGGRWLLVDRWLHHADGTTIGWML